MAAHAEESAGSEAYLLPAQRGLQVLVIGLLLLAALAVRAWRANAPFAAFHPTRQYRCALIARARYTLSLASSSDWERRVAASHLSTESPLEPQIMEYLSVLGYHLAGGEHRWIPHALASVFWVAGGCFLYAIARKISAPDSAFLATAFYLFVPFGVIASASFQVDPLMIMLLLASVLMIVRYAEHPSLGRLIAAACVSSLAILVKPPICALPIFGVFLALAILKRGIFRAIISPHFFLFAAISVAPSAAYVFYGTFIAGFLVGPAGQSFLPLNMLYGYFWRGWFWRINETVGWPALWLGLFGLFAFRGSFAKALATGLWVAYFFFGLVFNYGIYTHNYYQLMLIPIVALSLVPIADAIVAQLRQPTRPRYVRLAARGVLVLALCCHIGLLYHRHGRVKHESRAKMYEEIGDVLDHSTRVLMLSGVYGKPLKYYGRVGGRAWPQGADFGLYRLQGRPGLSAAERLDQLIEQGGFEFFVVTAMRSYRTQHELREVLTKRYRTMRNTGKYIIFDLRERIDLDNGGPQKLD